jgi:hypothetical protein
MTAWYAHKDVVKIADLDAKNRIVKDMEKLATGVKR